MLNLNDLVRGRFSLSKNLYFKSFAAFSRIFVFLLTCAAEKLLVSENRFISGFQGRVGGIGGSRAQSENPKNFGERHFRQESDDFVDTLKRPRKRSFFYNTNFLI